MNGDVKSYYSEMTDVIRDYIEEVFEIPAKESTTSELIQHLLITIKTKKIKLHKETVNDLKRVLQTADLVKFADRKSTRLNSSHVRISYAVFCLKKKNKIEDEISDHDYAI